MNRLLRFLSLALVVMLGGCTAMMESSSYGSSDLYITNNRIMVAEELKAKAEAERAEAEARKAMWEARRAEAEYYAATGENYNTILADDYESAYARRLYGFNSPTYRLPSSYYALATSDAMRYASAYDPAYYNIMVSGDQVWVEPKYVTSMFGSWGATNVTFGIYASPWAFGWSVYTSPFYYTMWGYPHYSWYDWNWNMCYNPYHWGYGYYAGYYPHYHHHHHYYPHHYPSHPPQHRPSHGHGMGANDRFHTNERRHSASRYTSPTSNENYGRNLNGGRVGSSIRNSGTTSSGMNTSRINGGAASGSSSSRYSTTSGRSTTNTKNGTTNSGSNFRSSSSSRGTVSNSSSSSSNRGTVSNSSSNSSRSNSSSNFRSSSSSSSRSSSSSSSSSNFRSSGSSSSGRSSTSRR